MGWKYRRSCAYLVMIYGRQALRESTVLNSRKGGSLTHASRRERGFEQSGGSEMYNTLKQLLRRQMSIIELVYGYISTYTYLVSFLNSEILWKSPNPHPAFRNISPRSLSHFFNCTLTTFIHIKYQYAQHHLPKKTNPSSPLPSQTPKFKPHLFSTTNKYQKKERKWHQKDPTNSAQSTKSPHAQRL